MFLAAPSLCCFAWAFSRSSAQASHCAGSSHCGAQVLDAQALACGSAWALQLMVYGLSRSVAHGIFPDQD